ncbi:hypothetical protein CPB97_000040 [Podila verticillata]|nr:hypothetical protein CPB97_000040 [Podila verticillata]
MVNTLMVFIASDPGAVVHVPFTPYEPIHYLIDRISSLLEDSPERSLGRELFVNGFQLEDFRSIDEYRILGNAFSSLIRPPNGFTIFVDQGNKTLHILCSPQNTVSEIKERIQSWKA